MRSATIALLGLAAACTPPRPPDWNCVPGVPQECLCVGGLRGVQVCEDDWIGFSPCACPDAGIQDPGPVADAGADSGPDPAPEPGPDLGPCTPSCAGRQCGDDGCGGACGSCPATWTCAKGACTCASGCVEIGCETDANCPDGLLCNRGMDPAVCRPPSMNDGPCGQPEDCGPGLYCLAGACRDGSAGDPCEVAAECVPGLACRSDGTCRVPAIVGAACDGTRDCGPGLVCRTRRCEPWEGPGASCESDDTCLGGTVCPSGTCAAPSGPGGPCKAPGHCAAGTWCFPGCPGTGCEAWAGRCVSGTEGEPCDPADPATCDGDLACLSLLSVPTCTVRGSDGFDCACPACETNPAGTCAGGLVCNTAIGTPGKLAGRCASPSPKDAPCDVDGHCKAGLVCNDGLKPGRCHPPGEAGEPCGETSDCLPGLVCNGAWNACIVPGGQGAFCATIADCASGLGCNAGLEPRECRLPGATGDPCGHAADCASGLVCASGSCRLPAGPGGTCAKTGDCEDGLWCGADSRTCQPGVEGALCAFPDGLSCPPAFHCAWSGSAETCLPRAGIGGTCSHPVECLPGLLCLAGLCSDPMEEGGACASDADCGVGLMCNFQSCRPPGELGVPCQIQSHCRIGLRCLAATCQPPSGSNGVCQFPQDCKAGLVCNAAYFSPLCLAPSVVPGSPCVSQSACATGLYCGPDSECHLGKQGDPCHPDRLDECDTGLSCLRGFQYAYDVGVCDVPHGPGLSCWSFDDCAKTGTGPARYACISNVCSPAWQVQRLSEVSASAWEEARLPFVSLPGGVMHLFRAWLPPLTHWVDQQGKWSSAIPAGSAIHHVSDAWMDGAGGIQVFGTTRIDGGGYLRRGRYLGGTWEWSAAGPSPVEGAGLAAALDGKGRAHTLSGDPGTGKPLWYRAQAETGWLTEPIPESAGASVFAIAVEPAGRSHVVFRSASPSPGRVACATRGDSGWKVATVWLEEADGGMPSDAVAVAVVPSGQVHAAFGCNGLGMFRSAVLDAGKWAVSEVRFGRFDGSLAAGGDGRVHLAYVYPGLHVETLVNGVWTERLLDNGGAGRPVVRVDSAGKAQVVYRAVVPDPAHPGSTKGEYRWAGEL